MIEQLETRLVRTKPHFKAIWLLPSNLDFNLTDLELSQKLCDIFLPESPYYDNIVKHGNIYTYEKELDHWISHWKQALPTNRPKRTLDCLNALNMDLYPNIKVVLIHFLTLPVTTCSVERSFSEMRLLKTWLRSTRSDEHLSALALMHFNYDVEVPYKLLLEKWSGLKNRLMRLNINDWYNEESTA